MIAVWMLYSLGIGVAFCVVGYALERALHYAGRPTRWAWVVALIGSYLIPVVAWLRPDAFATFAAPIPVSADTSAIASTPAPSGTFTSLDQSSRPFSLSDLDTPLRWAWGGASLAAILAIATAATRLVSLRRRWRTARVDGREVLVSSSVGPAVVGLWSPRIVLPEWALQLPGQERELMLAHEEQHVRAGDPALIAAGFALVLLAPWNLGLWWQWRRLRLAAEMDCDARVLAEGRSAPVYGELLIRVGQRRSPRLLGAAAFGEPASFLESRIRRMLATVPRWRWIRAAVATTIAAIGIIAACETPHPAGPVQDPRELASIETVAGVVSAVETTGVDEAPAVLSGVTALVPDLTRLAGIGGRVVVRARIETNGRADASSVTVLESPHPALAQAAKNAVSGALFRPARANGKDVSVVAHVTYEFPSASSRQLAHEVSNSLALWQAERLRPLIESYARRWSPSILAPSGPPMDAFLVADANLRIYRFGLTTLYYLGGARPTSEIDVADLKSAAPFVDPAHDGWLVVDPRALRGLIRDNVRVIWIHHDPALQDTVVPAPTQQYLRDQTPKLEQRAELVRRLARQFHPAMFGQQESQIAIALVLDSRENVLSHAARAGEARTTEGLYTSGESCLDVLTRLLPQYKSAQWLQSGCAGDTQPNVIVYWGQLLKH